MGAELSLLRYGPPQQVCNWYVWLTCVCVVCGWFDVPNGKSMFWVWDVKGPPLQVWLICLRNISIDDNHAQATQASEECQTTTCVRSVQVNGAESIDRWWWWSRWWSWWWWWCWWGWWWWWKCRFRKPKYQLIVSQHFWWGGVESCFLFVLWINSQSIEEAQAG